MQGCDFQTWFLLLRHPNFVFGCSEQHTRIWPFLHYAMCSGKVLNAFLSSLMSRCCDQAQSVSVFSLQGWVNVSTFHTLSFGCDLVFCLDGKRLDSKKCFFRELQWLEMCWAWRGNPLMNFPSSSWLFNKVLALSSGPLEAVLKEWACWALDVDSSKACFSQLLLYRPQLGTISITFSVWEMDKYFFIF